jgi:hypothetical protein
MELGVGQQAEIEVSHLWDGDSFTGGHDEHRGGRPTNGTPWGPVPTTPGAPTVRAIPSKPSRARP